MNNELLLQQAAAAFGASPEDCQPLHGGHFSMTYAFERAGAAYVLRITPPGENVGEEELYSTLALINFLSEGGVSVPAPLRSRSGKLVESITSGDLQYLAMAFEKAPGILGEELSFEAWNPQRFALLGRTVGRMHARAAEYQPASQALTRPHWRQASSCFNQDTRLLEPGLLAPLHDVLAEVETYEHEPGAYGLIHADLHGGNFIFDVERERITILDFDDCVYGWFAMDIAMSVLDFYVLTPQADKTAFADLFLRSYLGGYLPEFPLAPVWIERLPVFLKLLEINLYAMCAPFEAENEPGAWPARFMAGRKERILAAQPYVDLDFRSFITNISL